MNRSRRIVSVYFFLLAAACVLAGCSRDTKSTSGDDPRASRSERKTFHDPTAGPEPSVKTHTAAFASSRKFALNLEQETLSNAELARSSWENPFLPRLWSGDGWRTRKDSMTCESELSQPATFLRPYRNVVIECQVSWPVSATTPSTQPPPTQPLPIEFEVRMLDRNAGGWAALTVDSDHIELSEVELSETDGKTRASFKSLRRAANDIDRNEPEISVRMTMTPNRVLVAINGQMKINSPRPGSIMNTECLTQFVAKQPGTRISELRFEGD